jgi:hypothetical protein
MWTGHFGLGLLTLASQRKELPKVGVKYIRLKHCRRISSASNNWQEFLPMKLSPCKETGLDKEKPQIRALQTQYQYEDSFI